MAAKRRYELSVEGRASLRASIGHVKPWTRSTGPRTPDGKAVSSRNALKHGLRSKEVRRAEREISVALRDAAASIEAGSRPSVEPEQLLVWFERLLDAQAELTGLHFPVLASGDQL